MLKNFNWENLKPGEGIFLPAIDVYKAREMGLRAAILPGVKTYAKVGIKAVSYTHLTLPTNREV